MTLLLLIASLTSAQAAKTITLFEDTQTLQTNGRFDPYRPCSQDEIDTVTQNARDAAMKKCTDAGFKTCVEESVVSKSYKSDEWDCEMHIVHDVCQAVAQVQGSNESTFTKPWSRKQSFRVETPPLDIGEEYECSPEITAQLLKEVEKEAESTCLAAGYAADYCVVSFKQVYRMNVWTGIDAQIPVHACYGYAIAHGFVR